MVVVEVVGDTHCCGTHVCLGRVLQLEYDRVERTWLRDREARVLLEEAK